MNKPATLWLTRPQGDSERFAQELTEHGITSLIAPVMHVVPHPLAALPDTPHAILLTSRHAAHALASLPHEWHNLPVYCVGKSTANAATAHGCTNIIPGISDVLALLPHIAAQLGTGGQLLYLAGEYTSVNVVHLLGAQGIQVSTRIVYHAVANTSLYYEICEALAAGTITGVAFFSPRAAHITCELLQAANMTHTARGIDAFCFSLNVAAAAATLGWNALHTCHTPTRTAMRELIVSRAPKTL